MAFGLSRIFVKKPKHYARLRPPRLLRFPSAGAGASVGAGAGGAREVGEEEARKVGIGNNA